MAARRTPGILYALAFFMCMAIIALVFMYFLHHGWFLIHVPSIHLKLPSIFNQPA